MGPSTSADSQPYWALGAVRIVLPYHFAEAGAASAAKHTAVARRTAGRRITVRD